MQQSKLILAEVLSSVTKALLARNSRFAQQVLDAPPPSEDDPVIRHHIRALAELTLRINEEPQLKAYEDLPKLAETVMAMFENPSENHLKTAREIFDRINKDIQILMKKTPNNVNRGVNLILAANQYLEIAEIVVANSVARS